MFIKSSYEDLPQELIEPLRKLDFIIRSYLAAVSFIVKDTGRDPNYWDNHLLSYIAHVLLESSISIGSLATDGLLNVAKRELRFILESSIKLCFVQQKSYDTSITKKLDLFRDELSSSKISIKGKLNLSMLPDDLCEPFNESIGRLYGFTSAYVHLTPSQIRERIIAVDSGLTSGMETAADIDLLNSMVSDGLANSLVLLLHSVPSHVAGDWLVESDGTTIGWYFSGSRFVAAIDSYFDYKHERQANLTQIRATRQAKICF